MLATSRSGESLRRRSARLRSGDPSKSSTNQSLPRPQHVAQVEVAVVADHAPAAGHAREQAHALAHLLAAAGDRRQHRVVGQLREDRLDLLVERGRQQRERLGTGLLGGEAGIAGVGREQHVHRADDLAEALEVGEEARGIAAQRRERERSSRRSRRARSALRMPSVASIRRPECAYEPSSGGALAKPCSRQEAQQLELGIVARGEQAVDLEHELLADHDRGVRVALADRTHAPGGRLGQRLRLARRLEVDGREVAARRGGVAYEVGQLVLELGIGQRVVRRPAVAATRSPPGRCSPSGRSPRGNW